MVLLKLQKFQNIQEMERDFKDEFSVEVFFTELFQAFWTYLNHLPAVRAVQYHLIIDTFARIWLCCRLQLYSRAVSWRAAVPVWPRVCRCWGESLHSVFCLCALWSALGDLFLCVVIAFHPSNFKLLTSCSGVVSLSSPLSVLPVLVSSQAVPSLTVHLRE